MAVHLNGLWHKSIVLSAVFSLLGVSLALAASGDLDPTFSGNGWVITDFNQKDNWVTDLTIQPDGKILAAGSNFSTVKGAHNFALARYTRDGRLDRTFSGDGRVQTSFGGNDWGAGVALQPDGKIVAAGSTCRAGLPCDAALARYTPDGVLDLTFGKAGKVVTTLGTLRNTAVDVALQADGKIVVGGEAGGAFEEDFVVQRYLPDGRLDTTFSGDGIAQIPFHGAAAFALAIQPGDGKIVVVGAVLELSWDIVVVRLTPDGALDPTFSGDGIEETDFIHRGGFEGEDWAYAVAIQPDGKIVVAGETEPSAIVSRTFGAVVRYNPDGMRDGTFGDGFLTGTMLVDFLNRDVAVSDVIVQPNGKLALALVAESAYLMRLKPDGGRDLSFHNTGLVSLGLRGAPAALARQSFDGKYVVGGQFTRRDTLVDFLVARVLP